MKIATAYSAQVIGLEAKIITIEADISNGLHAFSVVGLGDRSVDESKDRVAAAIKNSGFTSPKQKNQKVVISLAPADIRKEGPVFDLGIAIVYLLATKELFFNSHTKIFLGELSLEGKVRSVRGVLAMTLAAKREGFQEIYIPRENLNEAALVPDIKIYPIDTLGDIINHFTKDVADKLNGYSRTTKEIISQTIQNNKEIATVDFSEISGQENAKRALEIAAVGRHNIVMYGPPGTGKTMLARALETILPPLTYEESLEVTLIHSVASKGSNQIITRPPFRTPHHTSSYASIIGGGSKMHPGEITLAHRGILFMDEFPEFDRRVIDALRQPLEDHTITVTRVHGLIEYPAQCILVAAMNSCPCGHLHATDISNTCTCTDSEISKYKKKISGPIADRIDLWVPVSKIDHAEFSKRTNDNTSSSSIRQRVMRSIEFKKERLENQENVDDTNGHGKISQEALATLILCSKKLNFSGRGYHRTLAVARTIADMAASEEIKKSHILEAVQYRQRD